MKTNNVDISGTDILEKLAAQEKQIRKSLATNASDFEELQSEWQERDSPAERNLREVEWEQYNLLQRELADIEEAREKIAGGVYGSCEDCGGKIAAKRLEAIPAARNCLACQELAEAGSGG